MIHPKRAYFQGSLFVFSMETKYRKCLQILIILMQETIIFILRNNFLNVYCFIILSKCINMYIYWFVKETGLLINKCLN